MGAPQCFGLIVAIMPRWLPRKEVDATFVIYDMATRHVSKYKIATKIRGDPETREVIPFQ
jgi:hypothetical protein